MRRYIHGDRSETDNTHYCQVCDLFVTPQHFDGCTRPRQTNTQRYDYWFKRLKSLPGVVDDRNNLFR